MTRIALSFVLVIVVVAAGQLVAPPRTASADIEVVTDNASNRFPNGFQFTLFFSSEEPVTDVRLRFRILPDGVNATVRPTCTEGRVMNCQAIVGNVGETYMVPGAEVVYSWQIADEAGGRFTTDEQTVVYEDTRFQWESISDSNLTVHYYFGSASQQESVLNVAKETIERLSALLNTTVDFPVKIWVYQTAQDMQPAVASRRGQGNDNSIRTLGEVGASDTALVSRDTEFLDIVRHELAHVVTRAATRGHLADIPVWINEGISTHSQNQLLPGEEVALRNAIQRNAVLPITSLSVSARGTGSVVSLFYAQSGSIVTFMIEDLGEEKFGEFIAALARDTTEGALRAVYGLDLLGLENAWRAAIGLPEYDPSAPTSPQQTADPTATPRTSPGQQPASPGQGGSTPSPATGSSGDGVSTIVIILGALTAGLVAVLAATGLILIRGRGGAG